jgi:AhpD family alkylhydroperoxidase
MTALVSLGRTVRNQGVPDRTLELTHLRASQINGCAWCVDYGYKQATKDGETGERLATVATWREAPYFTDPERAALALSEAMTRLSDRSDPVPDDVWEAATAHFDEQALAALVLWIATTNVYNRINVTTRQVPGTW